jgi:hypothetical protein
MLTQIDEIGKEFESAQYKAGQQINYKERPHEP